VTRIGEPRVLRAHREVLGDIEDSCIEIKLIDSHLAPLYILEVIGTQYFTEFGLDFEELYLHLFEFDV
jgi:hypothetical protein